MENSQGFTLIEIMIVAAIISILASIAFPIYQKYMAKSQITSAISELNGARIQYELIMNDGATNSAFTVDNMNFAAEDSELCHYIVHSPVSGVSEPALECQLLHHVAPAILGESIFLNRTFGGSWKCSTSAGIDNKYKPVDCV